MIPETTLSLQIHQQYAKLGIETENAKLDIRQPKADLTIRQIPAQMEIEQKPGTLEMNGEEARAELGFKSPMRMTADIAAQAYQIVLEAIGTIAEEGDQLAKFEKGISVVDIVQQRFEAGPMPIKDYGSPSQIHISYTANPVQIRWELGGADIQWHRNPPQFQYSPGSIQIYLAQKNGLQIDLKGQYLNRTF